MSKLMGKKRGMIQLFDAAGNAVPCTVIEAEPNVVTQIKTKEIDGYTAIQIGFGLIEANDPRTVIKRAGKPQVGHFKKAGLEPRRFLTEFRVDSTEEFTLGQELSVEQFAEVTHIDATAMSIGKGYQGVMKRHNYAGGPASHGSGFHRHAGSTGMRSSPGRGLPGGKKAGHMGYDRKTVQNIEVVKIQNNLIIVKGQVPGPKNGLVYLTKAVKMTKAKKK
jgi:large subunit ribosomal protein L3